MVAAVGGGGGRKANNTVAGAGSSAVGPVLLGLSSRIELPIDIHCPGLWVQGPLTLTLAGTRSSGTISGQARGERAGGNWTLKYHTFILF